MKLHLYNIRGTEDVGVRVEGLAVDGQSLFCHLYSNIRLSEYSKSGIGLNLH